VRSAVITCAIAISTGASANPRTADSYAHRFRVHARRCEALVDSGKQVAASCDLLAAEADAVRDAAATYLACRDDCVAALDALDVATDVAEQDLELTTPIQINGDIASTPAPPPTAPAPAPPILPLPLAGLDRDERDCELGDTDACALASERLDPDEKTQWQTRACNEHDVVDACFEVGDPARAARALDAKCRTRRDAAACHRLAIYYASDPRKARTYRRLTRRYAPRGS
jgi:hypothetical protein